MAPLLVVRSSGRPSRGLLREAEAQRHVQNGAAPGVRVAHRGRSLQEAPEVTANIGFPQKGAGGVGAMGMLEVPSKGVGWFGGEGCWGMVLQLPSKF